MQRAPSFTMYPCEPDSKGTKFAGNHYASMNEYVDAIEDAGRDNCPNGSAQWDTYTKENKGHWYGSGNLTTGRLLMTAVRDGWPDGIERVTKLADKIAEKSSLPVSVRRRAVWGDQGHEVDMDRVRSGNLDTAWRRMAKRKAHGPRSVRLIIDSMASGAESAESMQWRGLAGAAACQLLTAAGYRVELISAWQAYDWNDAGHTRISVVIKPDVAPYSPTEVAVSTAPVFFRALAHLHQCVQYMNCHDTSYRIGTPDHWGWIPGHETYDEVLLINQMISSESAAVELISGLIDRMNERNAALGGDGGSE